MAVQSQRLQQVIVNRIETRQIVNGARDADPPGDLVIIRRDLFKLERKLTQLSGVERIDAPGPRLGQTALRERHQRRKAARFPMKRFGTRKDVTLVRWKAVILAFRTWMNDRFELPSQKIPNRIAQPCLQPVEIVVRIYRGRFGAPKVQHSHFVPLAEQ